MSNMTFDELVASELSFDEINAMYGEETAINVGIARDPDAGEMGDEWFASARPALEVVPRIVDARGGVGADRGHQQKSGSRSGWTQKCWSVIAHRGAAGSLASMKSSVRAC